jgi:asparagine synthase (glutamine-hydrolysing)
MRVQAGIWCFDGRPIDPAFLGRLSSGTEEDAPAGADVLIDGNCGMVYRPFHTTSESRLERQPHKSRGGCVLTWDGRLDNRDELIRDLWASLGSDRTDAGIVMAAYEKWGTHCLGKLIGDWALALWNHREQTLLLARDYIGIRHLYYHVTQSSVIWCTNLSFIVAGCGAHLTLNDQYIAGYLAMYPEPHLTPYQEIQSVPPAKYVFIQDGRATIQAHSTLDPHTRIWYREDAEYEEHFRHVFRQAVGRRLRSDSPILAELSGGLDSSSIVCVADALLAKGDAGVSRLDTLSFYNPEEPGGDERSFLSKVEEQRGRVGHHFDVSRYPICLSPTDSTLDIIPSISASVAGLESDVSALRLKEGYRVVLSGIGGDEFLGGVPDPRSQLADLIVQLRPLELARQLGAWSLIKRRPWIQLLYRSILLLSPTSLRCLLEEEARVARWINPTFAHKTKLGRRQLGPVENFGFWLPSRQEYARTIELIRFRMTFVQPSPAGYVERRFPYLDQSLLQFLISIPASQLLRPGQRRSLMRRSLVGLVPHEILERRTKAVTARAPMKFVAEHFAQLETLLAESESARRGYINCSYFNEALLATKNGDATRLLPVLRAISLEVWLRNLGKAKVINCATQCPPLSSLHPAKAQV